MNNHNKLFLALLRSGITGQSCPVPEDFPTEEITLLAGKHGVGSLIYQGARTSGVPDAVLNPLKRLHLRSILVANRQFVTADRLMERFEERGIDYLPLKGCHLRGLYPIPEYRSMGDADILIRLSQYDRIRPLMEELGFSAKGESNHELIWQSPELLVELHKRLIPSYNADYYRYFGDGWQLAVPASGTRYTMGPEDEFIYLFTHFAKHYRDGGVGCRQVADLWVFRRAYGDMDDAYLLRELGKLGLDRFYENILALLHAWFEEGPWSEKTEFITAYLFDSGLFGSKETSLAARGVRNSEQAGSYSRGRLAAVRKSLFPDAVDMSDRYPVLKKAPWLKPVIWPLRWGSALLFRRDNIRIQRENLTAASREQVQTFRQALQYVGLTFGFEENSEAHAPEGGGRRDQNVRE